MRRFSWVPSARSRPADVEEILAGFGLPGYRGHRADRRRHHQHQRRRRAGRRPPASCASTRARRCEDVAREAAIVESPGRPRACPPRGPLRARSGEPWLAWRGRLRLAVSLGGRADAGAGRAGAAEHARQAGRGAGPPAPGRRRLSRPAARALRARRDRRAASPPSRPRPPDDPALAAAVAELGPELAAAGRAAARPTLPLGLIHGDLFIDNVLFRGDAAWRRCWTSSRPRGAGWPTTWRSRCWPSASGATTSAPDVTRAFIDGYAGARPPTADGAGGVRRRAALRRLPLRRHPHHRRVPAAGRRAPRRARTSAATCSACAR